VQLGAAVGWIGSTLVPFGPKTGGELASAALWAGTGTALGRGLPLFLGGREADREATAAMLAGGVLGHAGGVVAAPHYTGSSGEVLLGLGGEAWAGWQAGGWALVAESQGYTDTHVGGAALAALGLGSAYALGAPLALRPTVGESAAIGSGGLWGTWFGTMAGVAGSADPDETLILAMGGGDVGLLAGTALAASPWDPDLGEGALIDAGGLLGAVMGTLGAAVVAPDTAGIAAGGLLGGAAGLLVGQSVASRQAHDGAAEGRVLLPRVRLPVHVALAPWTDEEGGQGLYAQVSR
jgi:hypothetical protein